MELFNFFPFQWQYEDIELDDDPSQLQTVIRIYGWNEKNESTYIRVEDFEIPIWIELPTNIEWHNDNLEILFKRLQTINFDKKLENAFSPVTISFVQKQKLYYAHVSKKSDGTYVPKTFPFLMITFRNMKGVQKMTYHLKNKIDVGSLGKLELKVHCHESSITPVLKLFATRKLPSSNWIRCKGKRLTEEDCTKETSRKHEYVVSYKHMKKHPDSDKLPIVHPRVLSFDLEVYSSDDGMPKAHRPRDKVFMAGCTMSYIDGKSGERIHKKYVLLIGQCDPVQDVEILSFANETALYLGFAKFVRDQDPDVIIGYNIFGFDLKYMEYRSSKILYCNTDFSQLGCIKGKCSEVKNISWESSAYGKQDLTYYDADGRMFLDLLPYVIRNYKLANYRLETVCDEFLKTNKDPLKAKDIFKIYESGNPKDMAVVTQYCAQDTYVTLLLFEKLLVWFDCVEAATTNGVPMFYLYTKGQQIKMYSQVLTYCVENNIVVQSGAYVTKDDEEYVGATVTQPKAGLYKTILPFDFASLYPSIIMSHNIDYSKLILEDPKHPNTEIPDEDCHIFKWEEHIGCPHDTSGKKIKKKKDGSEKRICGNYRYRFLKAEQRDEDGKPLGIKISGKGVIPTLLENLIKARKDTRKIIAKYEEVIDVLREYLEGNKTDPTEEDKKKCDIIKATCDLSLDDRISAYKKESTRLKELCQVLDKRQLAYKVSANSMYGAMGVKKGYLPFLPGAMVVTYTGRVSIEKASRFLENDCGGQVVYNDTDSAYTYFPHLENKTANYIWSFAHDVVKRVAKIFPPPMKLEFEDKVYFKFLILTKKRYVGQTIDEIGRVDEKMTKRGIVLTRRDNCRVLRDIYERCILYILDNIEELVKLKTMDRDLILHNPIVSKLLQLIYCGKDNGPYGVQDMFTWCPEYTYKDFVITKGLTRDNYKGKREPVHSFVANVMRSRGIDVPQGSRIEYLLLDRGTGYDKKILQQDKAEDVGYFQEYKNFLRIDYLFYLEKQVVKPLDELLKVTIFHEGLVKQHFKDRVNKSYLINQIKMIYSPNIIYKELSTWENSTLYDFVYEEGGMPENYEWFFRKKEVRDEIKRISNHLEKEIDPIYPPLCDVFKSMVYTHNPKVIILGQDPYHNEGSAMGLSFSVRSGQKINPSLQNIMKELVINGFKVDTENGDLSSWAYQGVLLYNTALTVLAGRPESHIKIWANFTNMLMKELGKNSIGLLWGSKAISYRNYFDKSISTSHPSPFSVSNQCGGSPAFEKSLCFKSVNELLKDPINWNLI